MGAEKARGSLLLILQDDVEVRGDALTEMAKLMQREPGLFGIAPAVVMSVSFSGELAYEIHVPNAQLYAAYLALRKAGEAHGMRLFGSRAVESMRMEKGYLHWKADILTEFDPYETGLDRFVKMDKEFVGKAGVAGRQALSARGGSRPRPGRGRSPRRAVLKRRS